MILRAFVLADVLALVIAARAIGAWLSGGKAAWPVTPAEVDAFRPPAPLGTESSPAPLGAPASPAPAGAEPLTPLRELSS